MKGFENNRSNLWESNLCSAFAYMTNIYYGKANEVGRPSDLDLINTFNAPLDFAAEALPKRSD